MKAYINWREKDYALLEYCSTYNSLPRLIVRNRPILCLLIKTDFEFGEQVPVGFIMQVFLSASF